MSAPRKVVDKADAFCASIRKHVRSHERAGVVVTLVSDDGQTVGIESEGVNVSRFALRCSAIEVLERVTDDLRCCTCGRDHSAELAEVGAALFALRPAAKTPHGH